MRDAREQVSEQMLTLDPETDINETGEQGDPSRKKMQISSWATDTKFKHEWKWEVNERRRTHRARFAPMKPRVCQQNRDAAQEQRKKADGMYPMSDPYEKQMSRLLPRNFNLW
jgi:hypothetical protein